MGKRQIEKANFEKLIEFSLRIRHTDQQQPQQKPKVLASPVKRKAQS